MEKGVKQEAATRQKKAEEDEAADAHCASAPRFSSTASPRKRLPDAASFVSCTKLDPIGGSETRPLLRGVPHPKRQCTDMCVSGARARQQRSDPVSGQCRTWKCRAPSSTADPQAPRYPQQRWRSQTGPAPAIWHSVAPVSFLSKMARWRALEVPIRWTDRKGSGRTSSTAKPPGFVRCRSPLHCNDTSRRAGKAASCSNGTLRRNTVTGSARDPKNAREAAAPTRSAQSGRARRRTGCRSGRAARG